MRRATIVKRFITVLGKIHQWKKNKLDENNQKLRKIILDVVSEGECNVDAVSRIEIAEIPNCKGLLGFRIVNTPVFLMDIYEKLYEIEVPQEIKDVYPTIQEKDWKVMVLMIICILKDISQPLGLISFFQSTWSRYVASKEIPGEEIDELAIKLKDIIQLYADKEEKFILLRDSIGYDVFYNKKLGYMQWDITLLNLGNVLITCMMHEIELLKMPSMVFQAYPSLTEKDWEAANRIIFFIFSNLTCGEHIISNTLYWD